MRRTATVTLLAMCIALLSMQRADASGITLVGKPKGTSSSGKDRALNGSLYAFEPLANWSRNPLKPTELLFEIRADKLKGQNDEYYVVNAIFLPAGSRISICDGPYDANAADGIKTSEPYAIYEILNDDIVVSFDLVKSGGVNVWAIGADRNSPEDSKTRASYPTHFNIIRNEKKRLAGKVSYVRVTAPLPLSSTVPGKAAERTVRIMEQQLGYPTGASSRLTSKTLGTSRSASAGALEWTNANGNTFRMHEPHWFSFSKSGNATAIMRFDHHKGSDRDDHAVFAYLFDEKTWAVKAVYQAVHPASSVSGDISAATTYVGHAATAAGVAGAVVPEPLVSKAISIGATVTAVTADGIGRIANIASNQADTGGLTAMLDECSLRSLVAVEAAAQEAEGQRVGYQDAVGIRLAEAISAHLKKNVLGGYPKKNGQAFEFNSRFAPIGTFPISEQRDILKTLGDHNYRIYKPYIMWAGGEVHVTVKMDHIRGAAKDDYASARLSINPVTSDVTLYPLVKAGGGKTNIASNVGMFAINTAVGLAGIGSASAGGVGKILSKSTKMQALGSLKAFSGRLTKLSTKIGMKSDDVAVGAIGGEVFSGAVDWAIGTYAMPEVEKGVFGSSSSSVDDESLSPLYASLPEDRRHFGVVAEAVQRTLAAHCMQVMAQDKTIQARIQKMLDESRKNPFYGMWMDNLGSRQPIFINVVNDRVIVQSQEYWSPATGKISGNKLIMEKGFKLTGTASSDYSTISWTNGATWSRDPESVVESKPFEVAKLGNGVTLTVVNNSNTTMEIKGHLSRNVVWGGSANLHGRRMGNSTSASFTGTGVKCPGNELTGVVKVSPSSSALNHLNGVNAEDMVNRVDDGQGPTQFSTASPYASFDVKFMGGTQRVVCEFDSSGRITKAHASDLSSGGKGQQRAITPGSYMEYQVIRRPQMYRVRLELGSSSLKVSAQHTGVQKNVFPPGRAGERMRARRGRR